MVNVSVSPRARNGLPRRPSDGLDAMTYPRSDMMMQAFVLGPVGLLIVV